MSKIGTAKNECNKEESESSSKFKFPSNVQFMCVNCYTCNNMLN